MYFKNFLGSYRNELFWPMCYIVKMLYLDTVNFGFLWEVWLLDKCKAMDCETI